MSYVFKSAESNWIHEMKCNSIPSRNLGHLTWVKLQQLQEQYFSVLPVCNVLLQ